jgi:hypothetical protein
VVYIGSVDGRANDTEQQVGEGGKRGNACAWTGPNRGESISTKRENSSGRATERERPCAVCVAWVVVTRIAQGPPIDQRIHRVTWSNNNPKTVLERR